MRSEHVEQLRLPAIQAGCKAHDHECTRPAVFCAAANTAQLIPSDKDIRRKPLCISVPANQCSAALTYLPGVWAHAQALCSFPSAKQRISAWCMQLRAIAGSALGACAAKHTVADVNILAR